ncbi:hypothetical protein FA13DRAFT_1735480 [Coprinellus micaceus]|uniref:Uncharacterized protein n=1 Tax=Coprinellus micaceus TaxID=71717 RepID=A0A4Y7T3Z3_COPMI|nr:hypothetical protein FA13DRAFT_1735480 [Coprinellus micaceus]
MSTAFPECPRTICQNRAGWNFELPSYQDIGQPVDIGTRKSVVRSISSPSTSGVYNRAVRSNLAWW